MLTESGDVGGGHKELECAGLRGGNTSRYCHHHHQDLSTLPWTLCWTLGMYHSITIFHPQQWNEMRYKESMTNALSLQSYPTVCYPMDCGLLGFSVHGILQASILEWVAMSSSRGSSQPRDWTLKKKAGLQYFTHLATFTQPSGSWVRIETRMPEPTMACWDTKQVTLLGFGCWMQRS